MKSMSPANICQHARVKLPKKLISIINNAYSDVLDFAKIRIAPVIDIRVCLKPSVSPLEIDLSGFICRCGYNHDSPP